MKIELRKALMAGLVCAFVGQTWLVYGDDTADSTPALSRLALEGRRLWHANNCQTCHQIYGFGGFLGPDLTNAAERLQADRARLELLLTEGSLQMPPFGFSPAEIDAIEAYLRGVAATGVGQARRQRPVDRAQVDAVIDEHARENPLCAEGLCGLETFRVRCCVCHTPFRATPLGPSMAPDLAGVTRRLTIEQIEQVLTAGRPEKGMPPTGFTPAERAEVIAFLTWLGEHEAVLRPRFDDGEIEDGLPWWEYR